MVQGMQGLPGLRTTPGKGGAFKDLVARQDREPRIQQVLRGGAQPLGECLVDALAAGMGVLLAPTSDGGALSITVYDGDDRMRTYVTNPDELSEALDALGDLSTAKTITGPPKKPKGAR